MSQEPPLWAKLIATQPDKPNIPLHPDNNDDEHPFANEWSILQNQDGKIFIKNISAPYLRVEETTLQINEEKELVSGERLCLSPKKNHFDYMFFVENSQPDLKTDIKRLERIENDLQKELICPICLSHLEKCMILTPCLHTFCGFWILFILYAQAFR